MHNELGPVDSDVERICIHTKTVKLWTMSPSQQKLLKYAAIVAAQAR